MSVKVLIKRHLKSGHVQTAVKMLDEFRRMAMRQPGFISGETLVNHYDPRSITVVSAWRTLEDWINWQSSDQRSENEASLEQFLELPTKYEVYNMKSGSRANED
jgi:heme-degrading monooxygenase HmoA